MPVMTGATPAELTDANQAARLRPYLQELWSRRSYVWYVSASELRSRQITTVLGNVWHILNPALSIAVYYLIFGLLLETTEGVDNFVLFLTVGIFVFQYTQRATTDGAKAIIANTELLKAIKFPRAILPLTSTVTETMASSFSLIVIYAVALLTGEPIRWQWILLLGVLAVQFLLNLGLAMTAARLTTHFRDMLQILPFIFRLLLYGSAVIFSAVAYVPHRYVWMFTANPLYCYITISRWCISGGDLNISLVWSALAWTAGVLIFGFFWFRAAEEQYSRD